MLRPAIPVEAVMAMDSGKQLRRTRMISRSRTDFPVPARYQHGEYNHRDALSTCRTGEENTTRGKFGTLVLGDAKIQTTERRKAGLLFACLN